MTDHSRKVSQPFPSGHELAEELCEKVDTRFTSIRPFFAALPTENIVTFKFLLESYEGLGIMRTLNRKTGLIVILTPEVLHPVLRDFIHSIASGLGMREVARPEGLSDSDLINAAAE